MLTKPIAAAAKLQEPGAPLRAGRQKISPCVGLRRRNATQPTKHNRSRGSAMAAASSDYLASFAVLEHAQRGAKEIVWKV